MQNTKEITTDSIIVVPLKGVAQHLRYEVKNRALLTLVLLGLETVSVTVDVVLKEEETRAVIAGVVIGQKDARIELKTYQYHDAPRTTSDLLVKSIMQDNSFFIYEGVIRVAVGAQQTNAYQRNDSLMLSDNASTQTKPALEILADDVRCTHGATIGKIDDDQMFYLKSRGVSQKAAEHLITHGFVTAVLDRIPDRQKRLEVIKTVESYLI